MTTLALLEVLDRDGHVRQSRPIGAWPATVGRALDNDLVLDDPHIAAHHFSIDADASGVFVQVGDTLNGLRADGRHLTRGERLSVGAEPLHIGAGDSHLCLRLAEHALAPELPLRTPRSMWHSVWPPLAAGALVLVALLFGTWLDTDPDDLVRALGSMLMAAVTAGLAWCAAWALLSKIFTRRSHFWWHVRVLLLGFLALEVGGVAAHLLAFALSWHWASDFTFVLAYAIGVTMLYFHVLGLEPRRQ
uniref:FHA domain-containing protein n=1 Tax=Piscinibacter sp. TaxID=1903157 RepID=UPI00355975BD